MVEISLKQACNAMSQHAIWAVGCALSHRKFQFPPCSQCNPSLYQAAFFGALWGGMYHIQSSNAQNTSTIRRLEIIVSSALFPCFLLFDPDKPLYDILAPYFPYLGIVTAIAMYQLFTEQIRYQAA